MANISTLVLVLFCALPAVAGRFDSEERTAGRKVVPPDVGPGKEVDGPSRGPRIHMATNSPFKPYMAVDRCPPGTKPEVIDWPKPGDMSCEPTDEDTTPPPGVDVPKLLVRADDAAAPYKEVQRCPRGTRPVVHGEGKEAAFLCDTDRKVKDWEAEPPEGDGPRINIATNDPFKPYRTVTACPPGKDTVVVDWPRPGDMGCKPF